MSIRPTPRRMTFFYGLRSPYAWIAHRLITEHLPAHLQASSLEYVPFWDPQPATLETLRAAGGGFLYRAMSRERHLYILADVKRLVASLGYRLQWPVDQAGQNWELPHLACLAALQSDCEVDLRSRLFSARWEHGRNICDPSVLAALTADLGLGDPSEQGKEAVLTLRRCHRDGVFGLPYFIVGRERFWGVDRLPFALRAAGLPWPEIARRWIGETIAEGALV
jgi:2-hydroxychromene-2-carboxylate isomerase